MNKKNVQKRWPKGDSVDETVRRRGYTLTHKEVAISHIHENAWNPNEMNEAMFRKLKNGIVAFGFVDPILVRKRKKGGYEIIDGEHRLKAMKELGRKTIAVKCIRESVSDADAQALTLTCNKVQGQHNAIAEAKILAALHKQEAGFFDETMGVLPYSKVETDVLISFIKEYDIDQFAGATFSPELPAEKDWVSGFTSQLGKAQKAANEILVEESDKEAQRILHEFSRIVDDLKKFAKERKKAKKA
jgi:hypothetical protein